MKKDNGTIFNPVMYLMVLILTAQLLTLFVEYKRMSWVSGAVTDSMTDALLGACTLNETELYNRCYNTEEDLLYENYIFHVNFADTNMTEDIVQNLKSEL